MQKFLNIVKATVTAVAILAGINAALHMAEAYSIARAAALMAGN